MKPTLYQQQLLEQIGNRLYTIRHTKREKIVAVAREVGVSHPVISRIENGRYKALSLGLLCRIAVYYKMSVDHILSDNQSAHDGNAMDIINLLKEENRYLKEKLDAILSKVQ